VRAYRGRASRKRRLRSGRRDLIRHADFLTRSWPAALRLHIEAGPYSRNPYPESPFFDHLGIYGRSVIARAPARLREFTVAPEQAGFVAAFRRHFAAVLGRSIRFRRRLARPIRVCLLPLQVSDWYGFDEQVTYRTQFEFLIDVLSATPSDRPLRWRQESSLRTGTDPG
jgi:hypothetical protein